MTANYWPEQDSGDWIEGHASGSCDDGVTGS